MFMVLRVYGMMRMLNQVVTRSVKVSEDRLPEIYGMSKLASERLGIRQPDVYVVQDPLINAFTIGSRKKLIVLNTALLDAMDDKERMFVIGHELSHIKYGRIAWMRIAGLRIPIPILFRSKFREYTCDRGGLIACRDLDASVKALARLALGKKLADEIDVKTFYAKDEEVKKDRGLKPFERMASHPQIKDRINRLRKFAVSGQYNELASDAR
jgi:Zn-dependent protease with chaperone function